MTSNVSFHHGNSAQNPRLITNPNSRISKWLESRMIRGSEYRQILPLLQKELHELSENDLSDLWDTLLEPTKTNHLIENDQNFSSKQFDIDISSVDCISFNAETALTTTAGALNANIVWDLAKQVPPPDIRSHNYWELVYSLKEALHHSVSHPVVCTQLPHEKTRGRFWRLVFDHNIGTLLSLSNERDIWKQIGARSTLKKQSIPPLSPERTANEFWPLLGETLVFEETSIQVTHVPYSGPEINISLAEFRILEFQIKDMFRESQKIVRMVRYQSWNAGGVPTTHSDIQKFFQLWELIQPSGGICINCLGGVSRSGTLAAYFIANSLKKASVTLTAHSLVMIIEFLRKTRNFQMVQTKLQWKFLIWALTKS